MRAIRKRLPHFRHSLGLVWLALHNLSQILEPEDRSTRRYYPDLGRPEWMSALYSDSYLRLDATSIV
jgi:hypothetical protein